MAAPGRNAELRARTAESSLVREERRGNMVETARKEVEDLRSRQQKEREALTLLTRPLEIVKYFSLAVAEQLTQASAYLARSRTVFAVVVALALGFAALVAVDSPEHSYVKTLGAYGRFTVWWLCLGIASSIGLGSGLHTFVLYLGPHIARFTLKATACGRLNLKSAPYDTAQWHTEPSWTGLECSKFGPPIFTHHPSEHGGYYSVPLLQLMAAVQLEAFLWGFGTAIGELPPYFVSRAARLSGEKVKELEELENDNTSEGHPVFQRLKRWMFTRANSFGFFTILAFASVPNPLFDLAGITCGHFLVPFWKFFLATAIGKSLVKTALQTVFIVTVFNSRSVEIVETALERLLVRIPVLYKQVPHIMAALDDARERFSGGAQKKSSSGFSISSLWNMFVMLMLSAFLASIVSSTARGYLIERQRRDMKALQRRLGVERTPQSSAPKSE